MIDTRTSISSSSKKVNNSLSFKDCEIKVADEEIVEEKISEPLLPKGERRLLKSTLLSQNTALKEEPLGIDVVTGSVKSSSDRKTNPSNNTGATVLLKGTVISNETE